LNIAEDNFIGTTQWSIIIGGSFSDLCDHPIATSSNKAFVFAGYGDRILQSNIVNTTYGGMITFWLKYGTITTSTKCSGPSAQSATPIYLQFSNNNGSTWQNLQQYPALAGYWSFYQFDIPDSARGPAGLCKFRFYQPPSLGIFDIRGIWAIQLVQASMYIATDTLIQIDQYYPRGAPMAGGSVITVVGRGFDRKPDLSCSFGVAGGASLAIRVNDTMVLCVTPAVVPTGSTDTRLLPVSFTICGSVTNDPEPFIYYTNSPQMMSTASLYSRIQGAGIASSMTITGESFWNSPNARVRFRSNTGTTQEFAAQPIAVSDIYWKQPPVEPRTNIRQYWPLGNTAAIMKAHWSASPEQLKFMGVPSTTAIISSIELYIAVIPSKPVQSLTISMATQADAATSVFPEAQVVYQSPTPFSISTEGWYRFEFAARAYKLEDAASNHLLIEIATTQSPSSISSTTGGTFGYRHAYHYSASWLWNNVTSSYVPDSVVPMMRLVLQPSVTLQHHHQIIDPSQSSLLQRYVFETSVPEWNDTSISATIEVAVDGKQYVKGMQSMSGNAAASFSLYDPGLANQINAITPPMAPSTGGTQMFIQLSTSFDPGQSKTIIVRWRPLSVLPNCGDDQLYDGTCLSSNDPSRLIAFNSTTEYLACVSIEVMWACRYTPMHAPASLMVFDVSFNGGVDWPIHLSKHRFSFYEPAVLTSVTPANSTAAGSETITVTASPMFIPAFEIQAYIKSQMMWCLLIPEQIITPDTSLETNQAIDSWLLPAHYDNITGLITCVTKAQPAHERYGLFVSFNGAQNQSNDLPYRTYHGQYMTSINRGLDFAYLACLPGTAASTYLEKCQVIAAFAALSIRFKFRDLGLYLI
jgi:hypothetical protein